MNVNSQLAVVLSNEEERSYTEGGILDTCIRFAEPYLVSGKQSCR